MIVTDGRVQDSDDAKYRQTMEVINRNFRARLPSHGDQVICAATIGDSILERAIARQIGSTCVFPYKSFPDLVASAPKMAMAISPRNVPPKQENLEYETDLPSVQPTTSEPTTTTTPSLRPSTSQPSRNPSQRVTNKPSSITTHGPSSHPTKTSIPSKNPTQYNPELNTSAVDISLSSTQGGSSSSLGMIALAFPIAGVLAVFVAYAVHRRRRITENHIDTIQAAVSF
jgi:cobalamin biosynthesis Mg chelatase CobN